VVALLLALALAAPAAADPFDRALAEGAAAWPRRGEAASLEAAIGAFRRAAELKPGDARAEVPLARALAFLALSSPAGAEAAYRDCARAAERALRDAAPEWAAAVDRGDEGRTAAPLVGARAAEPLYWTAACGMGLVRQRGVAALLSASDELRALMERALALDETIDHAGPHRALGAWLAAIPAAAGGGARRPRQHFDRARALAPGHRLARVREAETLAVLLQDRALFDRLVAEVLGADPASPPELAPENAIARREAEALRKRADRLFVGG
jgi:hypothetical protein